MGHSAPFGASRELGKRVPELDGVRGAAVLLILIFHWVGLECNSPLLPQRLKALLAFGWSGVVLFFVLSGFLIGGILLDEKGADDYFKTFYTRRFWRILPLYGAVCLWSVAVFHSRLSTHAWLFQGKVPWYAYLTFGQNFWMAKLCAMNSTQIDGTWSLAIEEQFYLAMPFVIRVVSRKSLHYLLCAGILLAPVIRLALWLTLDPAIRSTAIYLLTPCRMDALLLGVLAACAVRNPAYWDWMVGHKQILGAASAALAIGILLSASQMGWNTFVCISYGYTLIALFYLSVLLLAVTQSGVVSHLFKFRPLTELGIMAYGLYLFQGPVLGLVHGLFGRSSPQLTSPSAIGITLLSGLLLLCLARLSWLCFEKPLLLFGQKQQYRQRRLPLFFAANLDTRS
jgi:peptidoglycan/LPS O-acetylase OafA/YrhL